MEVLKVSAKSAPNAVAGALAAALREAAANSSLRNGVEIQAVGAGAINQAVKAVAIARGFLAPNGIDIVMIPAFSEVNIDGEDRTAIKLEIVPR